MCKLSSSRSSTFSFSHIMFCPEHFAGVLLVLLAAGSKQTVETSQEIITKFDIFHWNIRNNSACFCEPILAFTITILCSVLRKYHIPSVTWEWLFWYWCCSEVKRAMIPKFLYLQEYLLTANWTCGRLAKMPAEFLIILLLKIIFLKMVEGKTNCLLTALLADHLHPPHTETHTVQTHWVSANTMGVCREGPFFVR